MAITKKAISQKNVQILRMDSSRRVLQMKSEKWAFLFGPSSEFSKSTQLLKIAVELDPNDMNSLRFVAYLYNPVSGAIDNAGSCTFNIYQVNQTGVGWTESILSSFSGSQQTNQYFFADKILSDFSPADFDGGTTMMVEVVMQRSTETFKERIYINHLGVYDSFIRLKQQAEFLDLTKVDE